MLYLGGAVFFFLHLHNLWKSINKQKCRKVTLAPNVPTDIPGCVSHAAMPRPVVDLVDPSSSAGTAPWPDSTWQSLEMELLWGRGSTLPGTGSTGQTSCRAAPRCQSLQGSRGHS